MVRQSGTACSPDAGTGHEIKQERNLAKGQMYTERLVQKT